MAKFSKGSRRQRKVAGRSVSSRVVYRMPKMPRSVEPLTPEMELRLRCVQVALTTTVSHAAKVFDRSESTVKRWKAAHRDHGVDGLKSKSRRPRRTRKQQWTADADAAVLRVRQTHRRAGKAKLRVLLLADGIELTESTIGRILASLKTRNLLREPVNGVRSRRARSQRPYATRVPKDKRTPTAPGALIQVDTVHICPSAGPHRRQFTAVDVVSRCAVLGVRSQATAGTAADFLQELVTRMPFPVQAIQVDGGSEFMAEFEVACHDLGITLYVLPPRSPKLNGRVERLNGTCRREFWEWYDGELDLPILQAALLDYERYYNTQRPHQALGYRTPAQTITSSYVSN